MQTVCDPKNTDPINSFSLVSYIPGELGEFLDGLRRELVCGCTAQSHVTVLPPRPLSVETKTAEAEIASKIIEFTPFEIELPRLRIFEETSVIFADVGLGRDRLLELHDVFNRDELGCDEPFDYYPHVTLAQGISPEQVGEIFEAASRRFQDVRERTFVVDHLTFVQNTVGNCWMDLSDWSLRGAAEIRR